VLPALASIEDFQVRFDVDDSPRTEAALQDASTAVRTYAGRTWVDEDEELLPVPDAIAMVTMQAAYRQMSNPLGLASEQIGQYSWRAGSSGTGAGVVLTHDERKLITLTVGSNIHTVQITRDIWGDRTIYFDVVGGEPIPYETGE
jgi:hypothetical protein